MPKINGLIGYRPSETKVQDITAPPYDVIKPNSPLEKFLQASAHSLFHVTLGEKPKATLNKWIEDGLFLQDSEPAFYIYHQTFGSETRLGVFAAVGVEDYASGQIIRHEKTFDDKVKGRLALTKELGLTVEPIFLLTKSKIQNLLQACLRIHKPLYSFTSQFDGFSELHGIKNQIYRIPLSSEEGTALQKALAAQPLYIADGHHRYHSALLGRQDYTLAYIVQEARIQAYNRVINGKVRFSQVLSQLKLEPISSFTTPPKNSFCIYHRTGAYILKAKNVPTDPVGRLDCSILEKELYPYLGVDHSMILNSEFFDYYAESELATMKQKVDEGAFDIAVALHPVSLEELMTVADAGLKDSSVVMPEKSTFFAPKILSGLFLYQHKNFS